METLFLILLIWAVAALILGIPMAFAREARIKDLKQEQSKLYTRMADRVREHYQTILDLTVLKDTVIKDYTNLDAKYKQAIQRILDLEGVDLQLRTRNQDLSTRNQYLSDEYNNLYMERNRLLIQVTDYQKLVNDFDKAKQKLEKKVKSLTKKVKALS
jgi:hypothetical protein